MVPAPPAGKRELMRRAYFDLIGLPPTPEEVAAFLAGVKNGEFDDLCPGGRSNAVNVR